MYCRKCGTEIPDDSAFCVKCGTPVEGIAKQPREETQEKRNDSNYGREESKKEDITTTKKKKSSVGIYVFVAIAVVFFLGLIIMANSPVSKNVYIYRSSTSDSPLASSFYNTFIDVSEDNYFVADIESGLGFSRDSFENFSADRQYRTKVSISGDYLYLDVAPAHGASLFVVTFSKPTLSERITLVKKSFSW